MDNMGYAWFSLYGALESIGGLDKINMANVDVIV